MHSSYKYNLLIYLNCFNNDMKLIICANKRRFTNQSDMMNAIIVVPLNVDSNIFGFCVRWSVLENGRLIRVVLDDISRSTLKENECISRS